MSANTRHTAEALLTTADVAERLRVGVEHVLALIHGHRLAAIDVSIGRKPRWRIAPASLNDFIAARTPTPPPQRKRRRKRHETVTAYF